MTKDFKNTILNGDCLEVLKELEDNYEINKDCLIRKKTGNIIKFSKDQKGYLKARLYVKSSVHKDKRKPFRLHRILAMKFLKDYSEELQVNHINGIKDDNIIENLEMVTNSQNAKHGWALPSNKNRINKLKRNKSNGRFIKK